MSFGDLYKHQRCSAADAVRLVRDGDAIVVPTGVAELRGKSAGQRAAAPIAMAHPGFRTDLALQARRLHRL